MNEKEEEKEAEEEGWNERTKGREERASLGRESPSRDPFGHPRGVKAVGGQRAGLRSGRITYKERLRRRSRDARRFRDVNPSRDACPCLQHAENRKEA